MTYVSLHTHSSGSFIDGFSSAEQIPKRAKKIGMTAVGITDHGEVNQHIAFQNACQAESIKPIFGIEGYLSFHTAEWQRENKTRDRSHICLFAETQTGLTNLWTLSTRAYAEQFYYNPIMTWEMLKEHSEGLIATDGCMLAYMAQAIEADDNDRIAQLVGQYLDTFGEGNFFLELHTWQFLNPKNEEERELNARMTKINQGKVKIAKKYDLPLIVVNDAHYSDPEDWDCHALVWNINTSSDDKSASGQKADWIMTDDEVREYMSRHGVAGSVVQEAIENTARIAARCNVVIEGKQRLPSVTGSPESDRELYLRLTEEGFQRKVVAKGLDEKLYRARKDREDELILGRNLDGYFLVVHDMVKWSKNQGMLVGPGRGSSAGSLNVYLLDINEIDPIKYGLLFERFLNEGRSATELPDIDLDFPQSRRQEVLRYLEAKYGADHVCAVGTLSRIQPKGAVKDLARALGVPYDDAQAISKLIGRVSLDDEDEGVTYEDIIAKQGGELLPWLKKYPELFEKLRRFIGLIRQSGVHASGVLISSEPLIGNLPMRIKKNSTQLVSQFENSEPLGKTDIAWLGFIKFDVLGIRHLDTLEVTRQLIKERHGVWLDYYDWDDKFGDPAQYEPLWRGETLGLFQIETAGGTTTCAKMKPESEIDLADLVSINRPGVIDAGMLDEYLERRHGRREISTPHPLMDKILDATYGVVVYQEQVIELVQKLAGYSLSEADGIRKIMGKKLVEKMKAAHGEFIDRCMKNPEFRKGCGNRDYRRVAQECWDQIEPSSGYSFNKSHGLGYSFVAAWETWVKYYYPAEFYTALLNTDDDMKKTARYLGEARKKKFKILPPDINTSNKSFTLTDEGIRFGITSIAGVGDATFNEIERLRPFVDFDDLMTRIGRRAFSSAVGEKLISIGALDGMGHRDVLLSRFYLNRKIKDKEIPDFYDSDVISEIEKTLVGTYITKDPLSRYVKIFERECLQTLHEFEETEAGEIVTLGGVITDIRYTETKAKKEKMAQVSLEYRGEIFRVAIFPRYFEKYKLFLKEGKPAICAVERLKDGGHIKELIRLDKM